MNPLSPSRILRLCLAGAAALVLAAPAGARVLPVDQGDSTLAQYGWGAAATVAKRQSHDPLAQYGWGAAATFAKQQTRAALAASADNERLAQYGWGAAATFAKLHA
jgi:hypothetical protein